MNNRALFLDRDGVINVEKNYVYRISDFEFNKGIFRLCRHYQDLNYKIFIVTNQSGIARGYYTIEDLITLHKWMLSCFLKKKITIHKIYFCPHHPKYDLDCDCRKPSPGMILQAKKEYKLDLSNSILIGDRKSDLEAGKNAGINNLVKIRTNDVEEYIKNNLNV